MSLEKRVKELEKHQKKTPMCLVSFEAPDCFTFKFGKFKKCDLCKFRDKCEEFSC